MILVPEKREFPRAYILKTLEEFRKRNLKSIVEIGCIRSPMDHSLEEFDLNCGDGHSSVFWANETDDFITVDIEKSSIDLAISECKKHTGRTIKGFAMDGIEFLENHNTFIDLLYLDAWDVGLPLSPENHLLAFKATEKNLHEKSLVLIDDVDCEMIDTRLHFSETCRSGKGKLVIPYAESKGWKVLFTGRQALLSR